MILKNPILIFDFDGTIADTHSYIIQISNILAQQFNYNAIHPEEKDRLKDKSTVEIIQHLKIPFMKIPAIISQGKKEYYKNLLSIEPIEGIKEVLKQFKQLNITMGILSSNSMENIQKFLSLHELDIFNFIHTTPKIWSKNTSLDKLIKSNEFNLQSIFYIGDEIRDITAAQKLGVKVAAVCWGYNSSKVLKNYKPDFLLYHPQELSELIHFTT